jgi:hypothetical protein
LVDYENKYLHLKSQKIDLDGALNIAKQEREFAQARTSQMETMVKRKDEYIMELEKADMEMRELKDRFE